MKRNVSRLAALAVVALAVGRAAAAQPADPPPLSAAADALSRIEGVEMFTRDPARRPDRPRRRLVPPRPEPLRLEMAGRPHGRRPRRRRHPRRVHRPEGTLRPPRPRPRRPADRRRFRLVRRLAVLAADGDGPQLLRRADADGDGKLSAEEWQALFHQAAKGKDKMTADDLRVLLFPPQPRPSGPPSGNAVAAHAPAGLPQQRNRLAVRGAGGRPARPGLHAPHAGRQGTLPPRLPGRPSAGAGLRQLHLRALSVPVWGHRRAEKSLRRPRRLPRRLRPRGAPDGRLAHGLQRQGRRLLPAAADATRTAARSPVRAATPSR